MIGLFYARNLNALAGAARLSASVNRQFKWDADYLYFSVREPWPSKASSAEITFGKVIPGEPLQLTSRMPETGVIFSDGIEKDFVEFNAGTQATITVGDRKGNLVA